MIFRVLGLITFLGCLALAMIFESHSNAEGALRILHWPAILLTGLGPIGLIVLCVGGKDFLNSLQKTIWTSPERFRRELATEEKSYAGSNSNISSKETDLGNLTSSQSLPEGPYRFIREKMAAGVPLQDIRELLCKESDWHELRYSEESRVLNLGVRLAPSIGMLGTILGIVQVLAKLSDPSGLGPAMSLALLTTFFGLFFSVALWTPLQQRLDTIQELLRWRYERADHYLQLLIESKPPEYLDLIGPGQKNLGKSHEISQ